MRPLKNKRGLTLMELTIVVVTIGVLAAMAAPRYLNYIPKLRTKSAVKEIVSQLRLARSAAIADKNPVGVHFNYYDGNYTLFRDSIGLGTELYDLGDPVVKTSKLPNGIEMAYMTIDNDVVVFNSDGSASTSGTISLVAETTEQMYEISIVKGTGKVRMEEVGDFN